MKFSVVVVTYNRLSLLQECLEAILHQKEQFDSIFIIDNNSTDGSVQFLQDLDNNKINVFYSKQNLGGAYGFTKGLEIAYEHGDDWILMIDDDAILSEDYLLLVKSAIENDNQKYCAYAGVVKTEGVICCRHRVRTPSKIWFNPISVHEKEYLEKSFECDFASFCGLMINKKVIEQIGLPRKEYFIWHDDAEYSLRIRKISKIKNINDAVLNHKTSLNLKQNEVNWKTYYGIRNKINMVRDHYGKIGLLYCMIKIYGSLCRDLLKSIVKIEKCDFKLIYRLYKDAINDGMTNVLGKNSNYIPGKKNL